MGGPPMSLSAGKITGGPPVPRLLPKFLPPLPAGLFHFAFGSRPSHAMKHGHAKTPFLHPVARELAALGFGEDLADLVDVDYARATRANRELARPAASPADVILDSVLIHHVNNASQGSNRFRIRERRRIAVLDHDVEARTHE